MIQGVDAMRPFPTPTAPWMQLAPIRAGHYVQLDVYTDTRNIVHIWLPEGYGNDPHNCSIPDRTEDRRFHMEEESLVTTFNKPDGFDLRGEVSPIEDGVSLKLWFFLRPNRMSKSAFLW